jgi:hypothetical protein
VTLDTVRHYCRNPRCRSKLASPVENPRDAFCARGCHTQFYRSRCLVCERPMERKSEKKKLCGRRKCENEFRTLKACFGLGRYLSPIPAELDARNPLKQGVSGGDKPSRPWRQIAGPELSETSFRLATLKPHPRIKWDIDNTASIGPKDWPVNIIGGYRIRQRVIHVDFRKGRDGLA